MHRSERQTAILQEVTERGSCTVAELAQWLEVSDETIRRDLKVLIRDGVLHKVHGGVTLPDLYREPGFLSRMLSLSIEKQAIARAVAALVADGDKLIFDTGSTTAYVARALQTHRDLLVVTNSVDIARSLATRNGNRVYMAGGLLRADDGAALGPSAINFVEQFRLKTAILSIAAIDAEEGLMNHHLEEAEFSRVVVERAEQVVVVADHTKFGRRALIHVLPLSRVDVLVTNKTPPEPFQRLLAEAGTRVIVP
jgi:DeoR family glycerol-3-phosphate regulon repressor